MARRLTNKQLQAIHAKKLNAAIVAQRPGEPGFVRHKVPEGKRQAYLSHVESERTGPKPEEIRQRHISYLGKATPNLVKKLKVNVPKKFVTE